MILIAHRGNVNGKNPERENSEEYVREALDRGYHTEVDVWFVKEKLFLGHDKPEYPTTLEFLRNDRIICHAKTVPTFNFLLTQGLHCFFHDKDEATLTSQGKIWLYPGKIVCELGILVMPEWESIDYGEETWIDFVKKSNCWGVCSDYVIKLI